MIVFLVFLADTVQDIRKGEIFLRFTMAVIAAGLFRKLLPVLTGAAGITPASAAGAAAPLMPGILFLLSSRLTGGKVGAGDGLAVLAAGFWTTLPALLPVCLLALALVPAAAVLSAFCRHQRREWPFLPFLLTAWVICAPFR